MGKKILFAILGVFVGLIVGSLANMAFIILNTVMHAPPEGVDFKDPEAMKAFIAGLPVLGFLLVLVAHSSQAFLGSIIGTLISGRRSLLVAGIIGAMTLIGCVINLINYPSPVWFAILDVALPLPAAWLGAKLVLRKDEGQAEPAAA